MRSRCDATHGPATGGVGHRPTGIRSAGSITRLCAVAVLLAGCSSAPVRSTVEPPARPPGSYSTTPPSSPAQRKGGGYYLDDGPGDSPPANLELLPDAVPRIEKYASGANRPYNVFGVDYVPDLSGAAYKQRGTGSWYGRKFHGQRTSSGEIYDMYAMTAAHPTLPIPCYALVTNLQNGRSVIVRVNDRGPFLHNRVMDLSYAAAYKVGYLSSGSGLIEVEMLMPVDIAAGRIPQTTTGALLAASMPSSSGTPRVTTSVMGQNATTSATTSLPASARPSPQPSPASSGDDALTIEALIASGPAPATSRPPLIAASGAPAPGASGLAAASSGTGLPPAPTMRVDAASRSLPLPMAMPVTNASTDPALDLVALPDRQPPAALPEIATSTGFYLQLGAFRGKAGADSFASHVGREIDPALASRLHVIDGNGLYRVRVGPYVQRADADSAAATLRAAIATPILVMPDGLAR